MGATSAVDALSGPDRSADREHLHAFLEVYAEEALARARVTG